MSQKRCLFFRYQGELPAPELPPQVEAHFWRPALSRVRPEGMSWFASLAWWTFHMFGIFQGRNYGVLQLREKGVLCHRSCVFPTFFRFPFMRSGDLQIGDTWTLSSARGRGLARQAILEIGRLFPGVTLWYVTEESNLASIRVIEKAGFTQMGTGRKKKRLGLNLLAQYLMDKP